MVVNAFSFYSTALAAKNKEQKALRISLDSKKVYCIF